MRHTAAEKDLIKSVAQRDGTRCWYCDMGFKSTKHVAIEYLIAQDMGGASHISNLALRHKKCASGLGAMTLRDKVGLRHMMQGIYDDELLQETFLELRDRIITARRTDDEAKHTNTYHW